MSQTPGFGSFAQSGNTGGHVFGQQSSNTVNATGFGQLGPSSSSVSFGSASQQFTSKQAPSAGSDHQPLAAAVFGAASAKSSSVFGSSTSEAGQSNSAGVFGAASMKTSNSVFGSSTCAVRQPNSAGVFGAASTKPSSVFGSSASAAGQSNSAGVYGERPLCGGSGQGGLFGKPATATGAFGMSSGFGKDPSATSSSPLTATGAFSMSGAFGKESTSTSFSSPPTSSSNVIGFKPSLFSGGASYPSDGAFRERSLSGTMSSNVLFGKKQSSQPTATVASSSSTTSGFQNIGGRNILFGKSVKSSNDQQTNLFEAKTAAVQPGFPSIGSGSPAQPVMSSSSTSQQNKPVLFGKGAADSAASSNKATFASSHPSQITDTSQNLFGKAQANVPSSNLFGLSGEPSSKNYFGDSSETSANDLFAMKETSSKSFFGSAGGVPSDNLFGLADGASSNNLFGKTDRGTSSSRNLFGKTGDKTSQNSPIKTEPQQISGNMCGQTNSEKPSSSLFGKPSSGVQPKILFGKTEGQESHMLFGKTKPSTSQTASASDGHVKLEADAESTSTAADPPKRPLRKWGRLKGRDSSSLLRKRSLEEAETKPKVSPRSRLSSSGQHSAGDVSRIKSIIVKNIPIELNKATLLRDHFSCFGTIKRLQSFPRKNSANITFSTHEEAKAAKQNGKQLSNGPPLTIFWRAVHSSPKSSGSPTEEKPSLHSSSISEHAQDELASMSGSFDYQAEDPTPSMSRSQPRPAAQQPSTPEKSFRSQIETRQRRDRRSPTPPRMHDDEKLTSDLPDIEVAKKLLKIMFKRTPRDATEACAVLDARDKFLRLLHKKKSDLASAKAFTGTCEDMCAEKERYYREDIRRLALYEVIPSTLTSLTGLKSKVDHSRAVKEYSRSSADQEEPLPHELRPLRVLVITMNYLLSEVADQGGEGKWSEWYDFLWNRTRGIRKDITQQQLCEVEVAELLEKCARFHVFCSARLCEEDMMSFDAKINNENLTKCLQTLKELYADLEKRKIICPNEAEFRAYMVLMNLNQGDTLREVQQLRPEIRESPAINFALRAYNTLNSNNYVRFFRLIQEATFLEACALHRYFNQIRGQALRIIMKAHRATGRNRVMYPVQELIRLLRFEDKGQVEQFCEHYCLTLEGEDVVMDAQAFLEPEGSIPESRAQTLVEAKRTVPVGEIINGCPLPPLQLPIPSSSFDENGVFIIPQEIKDAIANDMLVSRGAALSSASGQASFTDVSHSSFEEPSTSFTSQVSQAPQGLPNALDVQRGRVQYSNDAIKSVVRNLILDEIDAESLDVAKETLEEERRADQLISLVLEDLSLDVIRDLARSIADECVEEEEESMRRKLAEEFAERRQRVQTAMCDELIAETVREISSTLAQDQMRLVNEELQCQRVERCSIDVHQEFVISTVDSLLLDVAQDVFEVDVLAKRERLATTEQCVRTMRCRKFFQTWRSKYLRQIRTKRAMIDFPSVSLGRPADESVKLLVSDRPNSRIYDKAFFVNDRAKLTIKTPMEVMQQQLYLSTRLSMASAQRMLVGHIQLRPFDLKQVVAPQLHRAYYDWLEADLIEPDTSLLQWKLGVSFPEKGSISTDEETNFVYWVRSKLCKDNSRDAILEAQPKPEGEVLSCYHIPADRKTGEQAVGVCVQAFHGVWNDNQELAALNKNYLKGMSALLFVCSSANDLIADKDSLGSKTSKWSKNRKRLHQMLKQKPKSPSIPLVLVVPFLSRDSTLSVQDLDEGLALIELHDGGFLSEVHVAQIYIGSQDHPIEFCTEWTSKLSSCLRFTASHVPTPPKLRVKPVSSFVEDIVVELYKSPVYQDLRTRSRLQMLHQSPNDLISLYNSVIEHAAQACTSDELRAVSWPAPELDKSTSRTKVTSPPSDWNSDAHLCNVYELVNKLRLPYFRYSDLEDGDWSAACRDVWAFIDTVTRKDSGSAKVALYRRTAELVCMTKKRFDRVCWLALEDGPCEPSYTNMAWTDLIDACIHYKLMGLRSGHIQIRPMDDDEDAPPARIEDFVEPLVYYQEEELDDWEAPARWVDALRDTETAYKGQLKASISVAAVKRDETLLEASRRAEETQRSNLSQTHTSVAEEDPVRDMWTDLKHRLQQERAEIDKFQSQLAAAVQETDHPDSNIPQGMMGEEIDNFSPIVLSSARLQPKQRSAFTSRTVDPQARVDKDLFVTPRRPAAKRAFADSINLSPELDGPPMKSMCERYDCEDDLDQSFSDKVFGIQDRIASQRQDDRLFELKLRRMMESSPLL